MAMTLRLLRSTLRAVAVRPRLTIRTLHYALPARVSNADVEDLGDTVLVKTKPRKAAAPTRARPKKAAAAPKAKAAPKAAKAPAKKPVKKAAPKKVAAKPKVKKPKAAPKRSFAVQGAVSPPERVFQQPSGPPSSCPSSTRPSGSSTTPKR
jgi:hypothetical protein